MPEKNGPSSTSRPAGSATAGGSGPAVATGSPAGPAGIPASAGDHGAQPGDQGEQAMVVELQRRVAELEDRWRRAMADVDNLRKRYEWNSEQQRARERAQVAAAWLPVLDHLELALAHATANPAAIVEGVRGVRDQALAVLAGLGFPRRDDVGAAFDPARHEAVAATAAPHVPPGTVLEVIRPAYGSEERQLRPAAVVVAASPAAPGEGQGGSGDRSDAGAR